MKKMKFLDILLPCIKLVCFSIILICTIITMKGEKRNAE